MMDPLSAHFSDQFGYLIPEEIGEVSEISGGSCFSWGGVGSAQGAAIWGPSSAYREPRFHEVHEPR